MTDYIFPEVALAEADAITRDIFGDYADTEDRIDHAAVSEDYHLTPETLAELRLLLDDAPQLPYRASPRTHGNPSDGPTYVALEAQWGGRWEEVATGCYDHWGSMGLALAAAAINALPALLDAAAERDRLARLLDEPRRSGCAVEIAGVRIAPCDERGQTADMRERDALRAELAHMREARDAARSEVERLTALVERVRALHYAANNDVTRTPVCETCHGKAGVHECGCWASEDSQPVCGHCNEGDKGVSVAWPCPTLRILDEGAES